MTNTEPADAPVSELTEEQLIEAITSAWMRLNPDLDPTTIRNVIVVLMRKGGAGKTTLILLLLDALRRLGLNVLAIDLDSQGNLSDGLDHEVQLIKTGEKLGVPTYEPSTYTICEVLDSGQPGVAEAAIQLVDWQADHDSPFHRGGPLFPGRLGQIGLISCYKALESMQGEWRTTRDKERLRTALLQAAEDGGLPPNVRWDVVLIDTPPVGSDAVHVIASLAAQWAQLVVELKRFGAKAVPQTVEMVDEIRSEYHHDGLDLIGYVVNDYSKRRTQDAIEADLKAGKSSDQPQLYRAAEAPAKIPSLQIIQDSHDDQAPMSFYLDRTKKEREFAVRVCQAAEAAAIMLLRRIGHPEASKIEDAWVEAWPEDVRQPFVKKPVF